MYEVRTVAIMIEQYIKRLTGETVNIRLMQGRYGFEVYPEDIEKFEKAASYAIPAAQGGFKLKTKDDE